MGKVEAIDLQKALNTQLHDLSQPLASLQCRLEISRILDSEAALREAVDGSLGDLQRLTAVLQRLRLLVSTITEESSVA